MQRAGGRHPSDQHLGTLERDVVHGRECLYSTTGKAADLLWRMPLGEGGKAAMIAAAHLGGAIYPPDGRFIAHPQPQFESGRWGVPIAVVLRDGGNTVAMVDVQDDSQTISWS